MTTEEPDNSPLSQELARIEAIIRTPKMRALNAAGRQVHTGIRPRDAATLVIVQKRRPRDARADGQAASFAEVHAGRAGVSGRFGRPDGRAGADRGRIAHCDAPHADGQHARQGQRPGGQGDRRCRHPRTRRGMRTADRQAGQDRQFPPRLGALRRAGACSFHCRPQRACPRDHAARPAAPFRHLVHGDDRATRSPIRRKAVSIRAANSRSCNGCGRATPWKAIRGRSRG